MVGFEPEKRVVRRLVKRADKTPSERWRTRRVSCAAANNPSLLWLGRPGPESVIPGVRSVASSAC